MRSRLDLLLVAALAAAVVVVVLAAPDLTVARIVLGIPFVCGATGYALLAVTAPDPGRGAWLAMLVPAMSLAVAILASLVLSLAGLALTTTAFAIALAGWTLLLCAVAAVRRGDLDGPLLELPTVIATGWPPALAAAGAVFAIALTLLHGPLHDEHVPGYTQLSAVSQPGGANVRIAVASSELTTQRYRLEVDTGDRRQDTRRLSLRPGQRWSQLLVGSQPGRRPQVLTVRLYRLARPGIVYRQVVLRA